MDLHVFPIPISPRPSIILNDSFFNLYYSVLVVKNLPANAGDVRDPGFILDTDRSYGERNGNIPQYSCLENPMDRQAWWAMVHRVAKNCS